MLLSFLNEIVFELFIGAIAIEIHAAFFLGNGPQLLDDLELFFDREQVWYFSTVEQIVDVFKHEVELELCV